MVATLLFLPLQTTMTPTPYPATEPSFGSDLLLWKLAFALLAVALGGYYLVLRWRAWRG